MNLIRAGEASGALDDVLLRLGKYQEQMAEVREKVISALLYPLIVMCVAICAIVFFMLVMVPHFAMMFKEMGRTLPLPTRILISISDVFTGLLVGWRPLDCRRGNGVSHPRPHAGGAAGD